MPPLNRFWLRAFVLAFVGVSVWSVTLTVSGQNVATQFKPTGVSGGGHLLSITVNPENTSQVLTTCDMSGVYRSINKGVNWTQLPSGNFSALERSEIQYAGTGANQRLYSTRRLNWGSYYSRPSVSSDGGATWQDLAIPSTPDVDVYYNLAADPGSTSASTQRMVLENYQRLWFTTNGGTSWSVIHTRSSGTPSSIRLAGAFWNGSTIHVGTNLGLFVSTNGGTSWTLSTSYGGLPSGAQIVDFCGAKHPTTGVTTLFAICVNNANPAESWTTLRDLDQNYTFLGLYSLTLSGGSPAWVAKNGPSGLPFARVDVSAANSLRPWAVTTSISSTPGVFKSVDGGGSWSSEFKMGPAGTYTNNNIDTGYQGDGGVVSWWWAIPTFGLDVSDANPDVVAITGTHPYLTENGGITWKQIYVNPAYENAVNASVPRPKTYQHTGLGVTTGWWMSWLSADRVLVSSTDIGLQLSTDSGFTWTTDYTPSDAYGMTWPNWYGMAQQPGTTRLYAAVADGSSNDQYEPANLDDAYFKEDDHKGQVLTSADGGQTWTGLGSSVSGGPGGRFPGPLAGVAVDASQPNHIYACAAASHMDYTGLGGIYKSTNQGTSWTKLTNPPRTQGRPLSVVVLAANQLVATYCARTASGSYTASSGVFYSNDGGSTWADRSHTDMQYYTRDISVAPLQTGETASPRWFVAVESTSDGDSFAPTYDGRGGVYRTANSGTAWTRIFAKDTVQSVTLVPGSAPLLYVTTSNDGLWVSANPYAATPAFTKVVSFPYSRARRVFVDPYRKDGTIWVTTQGGGVWHGTSAPTMIPSLVKNGANLDLRIDVMETSASAPALTGTTDLSPAGSTWTALAGITPSSTSITGGTRYTWASVNLHFFFSLLSGGYVRASRTRVDGFPEVSDVAGWVDEGINAAATESIGVPWPKPPLYRGLASTSSGSVVLATAMTTSFTNGKQYYLELASGHRIEINESGSINNQTLALDLASTLNTNGSTLPLFEDDVVRVREHWTLDEVYDKSVFHGTTDASTADRILFWNNASNAWVSYWLLQGSGNNKWLKSGDATLTDMGSTLVATGEGSMVNPRVAMSSAHRTFGLVRDHAFRQPLPLNTSLLSLGFPVTLSPKTNHLLQADGFIGNSSTSGADQFLRWLVDYGGSSGYDSYFYFTNGTTITNWLKIGDATLTNQDALPLFAKQRAFFAKPQMSAKPLRVVRCPWLP